MLATLIAMAAMVACALCWIAIDFVRDIRKQRAWSRDFEVRIIGGMPPPDYENIPHPSTWMPPLTDEDRAYLESIEHITASLKTYGEARELAKGCPAPERYAFDDGDDSYF